MSNQQQDRMVTASQGRFRHSILRRSLKVILVCTSVALGFVLSAILFSAYLKFKMKRPINGAAPEAFPIVVFWQSPTDYVFHARIVELETLEAFRKEHPNTTFLLPQGKKGDMERELLQQGNAVDDNIAKHYSTGRRMYVSAFLELSTPTRQNWVVRYQHGNDHVNVAYYQASANQIKPTHIERYFGPGMLFTGFPFIIAIWGAFVWLSVVAINRIPFFAEPKSPSLDT